MNTSTYLILKTRGPLPTDALIVAEYSDRDIAFADALRLEKLQNLHQRSSKEPPFTFYVVHVVDELTRKRTSSLVTITPKVNDNG